jgi:hypothetical protein
MKWEYRIAGGGAYVVLYDDSLGQVSPTYSATFKDKAEVTPGFGSPSSGISPNANTTVDLEIPLSKSLASPAAASADVRAMRLLKGKRVNLKKTVGADVDYWPSAVLESMNFKINGQAVDYSLHFTTQDVTTVEPN